MPRRLILIGLNEINCDVIRKYIDGGGRTFHGLRRLMSSTEVRTSCEKSYDLLEPWIQWPSIHTGMAYADHQLYRLGDVSGSTVPQFFEQLELQGLRVGAISPMNAANRLRDPAYFIPDPWTATLPDASWWSRKIHFAVSQIVNDNSQSRMRPMSVLYLLCGLIRFARPRNYRTYLRLAVGTRKSPWRKALFLDLFLHDIHMRRLGRHCPDFSVIFLNAGAHIQHHYFLNALPLRGDAEMANPEWYVSRSADPVAEMLEIYDRIVADYLSLEGAEKIFATGLSQKPYDRVKYYYRLKDHASFLAQLGVVFDAVAPRMTRDFLVEFKDSGSAAEAEKVLRKVAVSVEGGEVPLFGEVDNRGASLFVTLTYPNEVGADTMVVLDGRSWRLASHVAFVAIKNGMHQEQGFAYFSDGVAPFAPRSGSHVKSLHAAVLAFFAA